MSTYDAKQDEEKTNKIPTSSLLPNLSHINADENDQNKSASKAKDYKNNSFINLNIDQKFVKKLGSQEQVYFASIAPLKEDHIDVHCHDMKNVQLHYCCGLYMPISKSFTAYSILSTEFMTSLKKLSLSPSDNDGNDGNGNNNDINSNNNNNNNNDNRQNDERKIEDNTNDATHPSGLQRQVSAYKPEDYFKFHNLNKRVIVYVPGQQHASNEFTAAESIMNECLHFCVDFPYIVIPFIWPSEGSLVSHDSCVIAEQYCANELNEFIRRMGSLFECIDVIGHGRGCGILLRAMQILMREKPEIIEDTHVICIAPDMESNEFLKYFQSLCNNVRRVTLYTNTWDWKLFGSKWLNWTNDRAGSSILCEKGLDTIDTTELLSGWFGSNHYYLTNEYVKKDIIQALSRHGGLDPKYRNYVLPALQNSSSSSSSSSSSTTSPLTYYILTNASHDKPRYQHDDDPNQSVSYDDKQHERQQIDNNSNTIVNQNIAGDLQRDDVKGYVQVPDNENDNNVKQ